MKQIYVGNLNKIFNIEGPNYIVDSEYNIINIIPPTRILKQNNLEKGTNILSVYNTQGIIYNNKNKQQESDSKDLIGDIISNLILEQSNHLRELTYERVDIKKYRSYVKEDNNKFKKIRTAKWI